MGIRIIALSFCLLVLVALRPACADPTYVRFNTTLGYIDVELFSDQTPNTVANFLNYANSGAYNNSFIHRSVPGFVIQGGGFYILSNSSGNSINAIPANGPVASEAGISNTRGTLAMALSTGPDSATNEWFFNDVDNSALLDGTNDGGPFTVFGTIMNANGLSVMDQINNEPIYNFGSPFDSLPLINYNSALGLLLQNIVMVNSITPLTIQTFTSWQTTNFPTQPPSVSGPTVSAVNDGVPNLLKYLCDINPTVQMSTTDRAKLPKAGTTTIGGTKYLTLTYHQNSALIGVTVNVQTSPDLQTWTTVANPVIVQTGTDSPSGDPIMQIQVPATASKLFIRLNLTQP